MRHQRTLAGAIATLAAFSLLAQAASPAALKQAPGAPPVSYQDLEVQPMLPKTENLWRTLDFPVLDALWTYPAVVVLGIAIAENGKVISAEVIDTNEKNFASAAERSVVTWKLIPGKKNGKAVPCITVVTLRAELTPKAGKYLYSRRAWLAQPKSEAAQ